MAYKDRIISELKLKKFGVKGWMGSKDLVCEQCGKYDKTGVLFTKDSGIFNCMRCGVSFHLNKFLKSIGKDYLIEKGYEVSLYSKLKPLFSQEQSEENKVKELPIRNIPIGFKRVYDDEYLNKRGFMQYHYDTFEPGITNLDLSRKHTVIFKIFDQDKRLVGWLARSKRTKEWHKENLENFKLGKERLVLRYDNSPNTDFSYILGGIVEVTQETDTVILVEGLFDKVNIDRNLGLHESDEIKCLFTFGDTIKEPQIEILRGFKNLKNIYLLYDYGTIVNSKKYGMILLSELPDVNIKICDIQKKDKDPGDLNIFEINEVLNKSVGVLDFKYGKLSHVIQRK